MEFDHILPRGRFLNVAARRLSFSRRVCPSVCLLVFYVFLHAIVLCCSVRRPSLLFSNVIVRNFVSCGLCASVCPPRCCAFLCYCLRLTLLSVVLNLYGGKNQTNAVAWMFFSPLYFSQKSHFISQKDNNKLAVHYYHSRSSGFHRFKLSSKFPPNTSAVLRIALICGCTESRSLNVSVICQKKD